MMSNTDTKDLQN